MNAVSRHLLVVDDDDRLRDLLKEYLIRGGFRVTTAAHAESARRLFELLDFDLVVMDWMMPGEDGLSLTRWLRGRSSTPVLILTARGAPDDRIQGLSTGADDYLGKPFEPQELVLRIEAILRRAGGRAQPERRVALGRYAFDLDRGELSEGDDRIRLTEGEAKLLRRLAVSAHQPVERFELMAALGGEDDGAGRAVDVHVTRLRRKVEPDPKAPRYLQTVRGVGYLLSPD